MRSVENDAFQSGEALRYRVYYDSWMTSWITAGYGTMTVKDTVFSGRECYGIEVTGKSAGLFNLFFKVDDRFVSYVDKQAFLPWYFVRRTHEGSYTRYDDVYFNYDQMTAKSRRMERKVKPGLQDMVSAFYYMRTIDFDTAEAGDTYHIDFLLDDSIYHSNIEFLGRENVETELGVFPCMKFKPSVATGEVFTEKYPMVLWVTDDKNKIPVLGKSAVYVGGVTMELIEYSGLRYPLEPLPD
jgi:5-hydroxyisourate hydrolase-like protein (transthyretin family)